MSAPDAASAARMRVRIDGVVQGVGFRPFVFRLAQELALAGHVRNDEHGVIAEVEGAEAALEAFVARLAAEAPPLARVEHVGAERLEPAGSDGFQIAATRHAGAPDALVSPDTATCGACLAELFDPLDRRYRYPFLNCTDCGPRFTIVRAVPYDRPLTTMAGFAMCAACRAEYEDPRDRRFHAQPNACPDCGPRAVLEGASAAGAIDDVAAAAALLQEGAILAVKGIGGYHLACRADDERAVAALRARKHREDRPFALLARDEQQAGALVHLDAGSLALLRSAARPIVLAPRRADAPVAGAVAPLLSELGVMLPYSPLHHLLAHGCSAPLVLTSGNVADEPIAFRDEDARKRLARIADAFLVHDRPIHTRTDDSVARSVGGRAMVLRRARGYAPASASLPVAAARPLLACGGELKNTFCLARGARAWSGHHIGDLRSAQAREAYTEGIAHYEGLFGVRPELVAHDLHPDYLSTTYALAREGVETIGIQHHWAHLAACLAEHGEAGPAVAAIFDGIGLGADGTLWGGEILVGGLASFQRAGHLVCVPQPGGDRAAREPWRMACGWLAQMGLGAPPGLVEAAGREQWEAVARMAATGFSAPLTSSMGRLFDAAAALCGVRSRCTYEAQAAIEFEGLAEPGAHGAYEFVLSPGLVIDPQPALAGLLADVAAGVPAGVISSRFHAGAARATAEAVAAAASAAGVEVAVLSGGVFQNRLLLEQAGTLIEQAGLRLLVPERFPPGDGGIAFGQAAIAAAHTAG